MSRINYIDDFNEWKKGFSFYQEVKVRFSETDMFGHLNNTVPFVYFEQARTAFFKEKGFMQEWLKEEHDTMPVVADLQCDFLAQVYFDERLKIYVKVNKVGHSSMDLHYLGTRTDGSPCFTGRGAIVQISKKTGKSVPWTEEMKAKWITS